MKPISQKAYEFFEAIEGKKLILISTGREKIEFEPHIIYSRLDDVEILCGYKINSDSTKTKMFVDIRKIILHERSEKTFQINSLNPRIPLPDDFVTIICYLDT